jgi:hypothetical protein
MNGHRPRSGLAPVLLTWLCAALFAAPGTSAPTTPPPGGQEQQPEGVVFNDAAGTYTVHRVPKRSVDAVTKSLEAWRHQVLADGSTADYSAEDGILSMECSACGLSHPSAIDLAAIDLDTLVAYEAGPWHIGIRSKDGTQDFFGILRGEIGPEPHDPGRITDDRRAALTALTDLYDLACLAQNPPAPPSPTKVGKSPRVPAEAVKPTVASLASLAASGDVEGIQARRTKANPRDVAHSLEIAYGTRARAQMLEGKVDSALQTLGAGRQSFGKSAMLRDREAHYVLIGDAYDRLRLAVKLDVAELRGYLQQIQTLEPDDATAIEQMLVRTLSNRIADQGAAGRKVIVEDLLNGGRDLFPAWTDQLSQGTPGMLPQAGIEVGAHSSG